MSFPLSPEQQQTVASLNPTPTTTAPIPTALVPAADAQSIPAPMPTEDKAASDALSLRLSQPAPGSFGAKLGAALDKPENAIPLDAAGKPVPGGWARSLLGATQGVLAGLGDIPSDKAPVGAGAIAGISKTIANHNARMAEQQKLGIEKQKAMTEEQKAQLDMTHDNIRFQHEQALWHLTQEVAPMVAQGEKAFAITQNSPKPAPVVATGVDGDALKAGVNSGKWNIQEYTPYATEVKTDPETGYTQALFTVVKTGGPVQINKDNADDMSTLKFMNDNHASEQEILPDQNLTMGQFNKLYQAASDNAAATAARNKTLVENNLATAKEVQEMEKIDFAKDTAWNNALVNAKNDPIQALVNLQANPELLKKYPNLPQDVREAYGPASYDKLVEARQKRVEDAGDQITKLETDPGAIAGDKSTAVVAMAQEHLKDSALSPDMKARWTKIAETANQTRSLTEADKKSLKAATDGSVIGNPQLTGSAYLASIPQGAGKATIMQIGNGQMPMASLSMLTRSPEGRKLFDSVALAFPDDGQGGGFDQSKILGYQNAVKEFTSDKSGTAGASLNNGATAMKHLRELRDMNAANPVESRIIGTPAYKAYQNKLNTLAGELVKFYGLPNTNESEENMKAGMSGLTSREESMASQAHSMADKLQSIKQTWDNAAPSKAYSRPMPYIDADAISALRSFVPGFDLNPGTVPTQPQLAATSPTPRSHVFDKAAWIAKHPGQDVAPIAAQAAAAGYKVK